MGTPRRTSGQRKSLVTRRVGVHSRLAGRDARGVAIACSDAAHDLAARRSRRGRSLGHDPVADAADGEDRGPARGLDLRRRRATWGLSHSRSGSASAGQPARTSWRCGTRSPPARTSASSSRNSMGVSVERTVADPRLVAPGIEGERARVEPARDVAGPANRSIGAPHDRRDPRQQLGLAERLDEVVVRADAERLDLGLLARSRRRRRRSARRPRPGSGPRP